MSKLQFYLFASLLAFNIQNVKAGGDYWPVRIQEKIIIGTETISLKLLLLGVPRDIVFGCKSITVHVKHQIVPFWALLPFISTSHPTLEETMEAIHYLNNKYKASMEVYFGYIGSGLHKVVNNSCTFKSKGLRLERDDNNKYVIFSFFDPV